MKGKPMHNERSLYAWAQDAAWKRHQRPRQNERGLRDAIRGLVRQVAGARDAGQ
jgi:hypothetical protein